MSKSAKNKDIRDDKAPRDFDRVARTPHFPRRQNPMRLYYSEYYLATPSTVVTTRVVLEDILYTVL